MTIGTGFMGIQWEYAEVSTNSFLINSSMSASKNRHKKWHIYGINLVISMNEVKRR